MYSPPLSLSSNVNEQTHDVPGSMDPDSPRSLMTLAWSNSFMQAASRRKSSISERVQMATVEETRQRWDRVVMSSSRHTLPRWETDFYFRGFWLLNLLNYHLIHVSSFYHWVCFNLVTTAWNWQKSPIRGWRCLKNSSFPLNFLYSCLCFGTTVNKGSTLSSANIFYELRRRLFSDRKLTFLPPSTWPKGLSINIACVPKMKGVIVGIAEYFDCLLTLHSLHSNFEERLLLSQQSFHHGAKLPCRKKLNTI